MSELKAVILDIDGTLLLSNEAHALAFFEAAERLGIGSDYSHVRRLIGKGGDKLIPEAFGLEEKSARGRELAELKGKLFREQYLPHLGPTPGARGLLEKLKSQGVPRVVATSAGKDDVFKLLERAGIQDLIDDTTTADDADASKPDPDILQAALKKISATPAQAIMLGDTPYDVEAANRAHVRCIAVRCGGWDDLSLQGAVSIFDDPADVLAHFEQAFDASCGAESAVPFLP